MSLRPRWLAMALAAASLPALAVVPTDEQVQRLQQAMGFDTAIAQVMRDQLKEESALDALSDVQRDCLLTQFTPVVAKKLDGAFKDLFGDEQTATEWLAFAETAGGRKMMAFVRAGVQASLEKKPAPAPETALADMAPEEMADMAKFMMSPAARVLERDFPDVDMGEAELEAFMAGAMATCGIDEEKH